VTDDFEIRKNLRNKQNFKICKKIVFYTSLITRTAKIRKKLSIKTFQNA